MSSIMEIMQLCRLCLVKDQVNFPIFEEQGDIRQIFLKITACLPVKVAKDDNLPKKICDGCLYKLELLYQFWNTAANAEKQLLTWLSQAGMDADAKTTHDAVAVAQQSQAHSHSVKQEVVEPCENENKNENSEDLSTEAQNYIIQQQQLPYESVGFPYEEENFNETQESNGGGDEAVSEEQEGPLPKRRRRQCAETVVEPEEAEEDDDDISQEMPVTKTEEESDTEEETRVEDGEPTNFVPIGGSGDNEQPGPSGMGKVASEAPFDLLGTSHDLDSMGYECEVCSQIFSTKKEFIAHHVRDGNDSFVCCTCEASFKTTTELFQHHQSHKFEQVIIEPANIEFGDYTEQVEAVLNIPNETTIDSTSELLYILDDSQCVNEIVIEESESQQKSTNTTTRQDNFAIVQVDHGYMIPSVFKGQLSPKKRMKKENIQNSDSDDPDSNNLLVPMQPSTSRNVTTKSRSVQPKRKHEVPDFSAPSYVILNPNEDVNIPHYKCLRCEQLFINKFVFFRHIEKGKCYVNSCDVCTGVFEKNSDFYEHYLVEHTDRAICNFCFRTFMYEKNVKEHMLRHLDQFRHRCEECNKGFYTVREYRNHYKNRHMGIRHRCDECGRSFADEYYFKRHIATHNKRTDGSSAC